MRRAVFLDRDGTPHPPLTLADVDIVPGVQDALPQLRCAGRDVDPLAGRRAAVTDANAAIVSV